VAPRAVVLIDPGHPYAGRLAAAAQAQVDALVVCLWTGACAHDRARVPLPDGVVAVHLDVDSLAAGDVASYLRPRYDVVGVMPHLEPLVVPAAELADALGAPWCDLHDVRRFRDKHALKQWLRSVPDGPRVNASARVRGLAEVRAAAATGSYPRFVLKPNDGMNNNRIGFFDERSSDAEIAAHLADCGGDAVMEEYIGGDEYCVNGQVLRDGTVLVLAVYRTHHTPANGRDNLAARFETVPSTSEVFGSTAAYAEHVLTAARLRGSPFHMELKVDDRGPCLIECGARLGGVGMGDDVATLHHQAVDAFELAVEGYTGLDVRQQQPDWDAYDAQLLRIVCAVSTTTERIASVQGLAAVEAMPEFVRWVSRPRPGVLVHPTVDLATSPWKAAFAAPTTEQLDRAEERARALVRWNGTGLDGLAAGRAVHGVAVRVADRLRARQQARATHPSVVVAEHVVDLTESREPAS
jgi:hypothetical protein